MTIYIVNNNGEWLRRHQEASHVKDTDWWISPNTTTFRKALAGDLFFITKTGSRELSAVATLKHNYTTEVPETAWQYASPAYASAFTPRSRAAAVLKIPEDDISASSRVGLLVLTGLQWFDNSERPSVPDSYSKFIVTGKPYLPTDDDYDYLYDLSVNVLNYSVDSDAVRDTFARFTHAQIAEIIPRHRHLADRFAKWLHRNGYTSVLKEHGRVDIRFRIGSQRLMAELKICYQTDTLHAIRDAVGQLLEYNHYSGRTPHDEWWIVLDQIPTETDADYVRRVRRVYSLPIFLSHELGSGHGNFAIDKHD